MNVFGDKSQGWGNIFQYNSTPDDVFIDTSWPLMMHQTIHADPTRFTKRRFVPEKNTQKLEDAYIILFLFLNLNMDLLFKSIQRPPNGSHFSIWVIFAPQQRLTTKSSHFFSAMFLFSSTRGWVIRNKICDNLYQRWT